MHDIMNYYDLGDQGLKTNIQVVEEIKEQSLQI